MVLGALAEGPLEAALAGHRRRRRPDRQALSTLPLSSSSNPSAARSWPSPPAGAGKLKELTHHCTDDASVVDARRKVAPDVGSGCAHSFTFKDILVATGYFDAANFIGEGGFGKVYKGKISRTNPQGVCDAQMVAVKQLARERVHGSTEFLVEVLMLTILSHPNLVSLVGFCAQGDERLLVYEYMPFGSLESHLFGWFSRWIVQTSLEYIFLYSRRRI